MEEKQALEHQREAEHQLRAQTVASLHSMFPQLSLDIIEEVAVNCKLDTEAAVVALSSMDSKPTSPSGASPFAVTDQAQPEERKAADREGAAGADEEALSVLTDMFEGVTPPVLRRALTDSHNSLPQAVDRLLLNRSFSESCCAVEEDQLSVAEELDLWSRMHSPLHGGFDISSPPSSPHATPPASPPPTGSPNHASPMSADSVPTPPGRSQGMDPPSMRQRPRSDESQPSSGGGALQAGRQTGQQATTAQRLHTKSDSGGMWGCGVCTFDNSPQSVVCVVCGQGFAPPDHPVHKQAGAAADRTGRGAKETGRARKRRRGKRGKTVRAAPARGRGGLRHIMEQEQAHQQSLAEMHRQKQPRTSGNVNWYALAREVGSGSTNVSRWNTPAPGAVTRPTHEFDLRYAQSPPLVLSFTVRGC